MCDKPNVSSTFLSESGQLDRRHLQPVDADDDAPGDEELNGTQLLDTQLGKEDVSDTTDASDEDTSVEEKKEEKEEEKVKDKEIFSTEEMTVGAKDLPTSTARTMKDFLENLDLDFSDDDSNSGPSLIEASKSSSSSKSPTPAPKQKKPAAAIKKVALKKKRKGKTEADPELIPSDSENERSRKKAKGTPRARSLADALVEVEDKKIAQAMEQDRLDRLDFQQRLDREIKQQDQQHVEKGYQHQQVMLQLQLQLEVAKAANARFERRFSPAQRGCLHNRLSTMILIWEVRFGPAVILLIRLFHVCHYSYTTVSTAFIFILYTLYIHINMIH